MSSQAFSRLAIAAFPFERRAAAEEAAQALKPFVDPSYRQSSVQAQILGRNVSIPRRIHFLPGLDLRKSSDRDKRWLAIHCLCTRSTDGFLRQQMLRAILPGTDPVAIPFIALLAGEYVVEIINDIVLALPTMDHATYANFVRENRPLMLTLKAKATSYWDCFYREQFPQRSNYPGLAFLHEIERWAA